MSPNFRNTSDLGGYLKKQVEITLKNIANTAMEKLKENVQNSVYGWQPEQYVRTGQVLNAISRTSPTLSGGRYTSEIYFDATKIQPIIHADRWNTHASFSGEWSMKDLNNNLIKWLEYGTPNNPYYAHEEARFLRDTIEWIQINYIELFKKGLAENGIVTK